MKWRNVRFLISISTLTLAALASNAFAGCAPPKDAANLYQPSGYDEASSVPRLLRVSETNTGVSIVGLWHVLLIAEGNTGSGLPPNGATVDNGLSVWHSDKTEETLDSRPPQTGDVCFGVWEKVGDDEYQLNHFGISFDPPADPNNPQGYVNIRQHVWLASDGKHFKGTFSIRQYDQSGNLLIEIKGVSRGTRITLGTTAGNLVSQN
jgi:hypothetical protein